MLDAHGSQKNRVWAVVLFLLMTAGVAVNVREYPLLDAAAKESYRAGSGIPSYRNPDIVEMVKRSTANAQAYMRFYFALDAATESRPVLFIAPGSSLLDRYRLSMAVSEVGVVDYDPFVSEEVAALVRESLVDEGTDAQIGDYVIAIADPATDTLVEVRHDGVTYVADPSLLPTVIPELVDAG